MRSGGHTTITEAIKQRIPRIRKAIWANPEAYLRLPLFTDGTHGPWAELYDDRSQVGVLDIRPGSQRVCLVVPGIDNENDWETYSGPVSAYENDSQNFAKNYAEH